MNPHDDPRDLWRIKYAYDQKRRRLDYARRDEENEQWHTRRAQLGVIEYESIHSATAQLDTTRREEERSANTSQRAMARLDLARRKEENEQQHTRRGDPMRREE